MIRLAKLSQRLSCHLSCPAFWRTASSGRGRSDAPNKSARNRFHATARLIPRRLSEGEADGDECEQATLRAGQPRQRRSGGGDLAGVLAATSDPSAGTAASEDFHDPWSPTT